MNFISMFGNSNLGFHGINLITEVGSNLAGVHVRASLLKMAHRGNELRKAQLLQSPPLSRVSRSASD